MRVREALERPRPARIVARRAVVPRHHGHDVVERVRRSVLHDDAVAVAPRSAPALIAGGAARDRQPVPVVQDDLGSQVLGRPAERVRQLVIRLFDLRQTEVGQLDVALGVKQHIFRLQVAINNAL